VAKNCPAALRLCAAAADDWLVAIIPRMFRARSGARASAFLVGTLAAAWLSFACLAAPAMARVEKVLTKVGGPEVTVGLQPRESASVASGEQVKTFANASGNEVVHSANTYAIYWDPDDYYHGDWQSLIDGYLANAGTVGGQLDDVFAVDSQYTDKSNKPAAAFATFRGAYTDTHPYPAVNGCTDPRPLKFGVPFLAATETAVCVTAAQVQTEVERFIKQREEEHQVLPKGMGTIYYLMTPPGVTVCLNGGGATGHCSDFNGLPVEISRYEEALRVYPIELETYAAEKVVYEEKLVVYGKEKAAYEKLKAKYEAEQEVYVKNKAKDKAATPEVPDTEAEPVAPTPPVAPVAPVEPLEPTAPEGLPSYQKSFCSYHAASGTGASAILYAAIPWTAGGDGDGHLAGPGFGDGQTAAFACQDGGHEPGPAGEGVKKEGEAGESRKERAEFEAKDSAEKQFALELRETNAKKPHDQEPNQIGLGPDGSYDTGLADLIVNQIAVEQQDIITDPLLESWKDTQGNEVTDECRNFFSPTTSGSGGAAPLTLAGTLADNTLGAKSYYLNDTFNLAGLERAHPGVEFPGLPFPGVTCLTGVSLEPKFTAPNTVKGSEVVGFDGMESTITLNSAVGFTPAGVAQPSYAIYTWNFGDETPEVSGYAPGAPACEIPWLSPCAASEFHSYRYNGTYEVTLTVKDVGGNEARVTEPVTVVEGENRPAPPSPPAGGGGSGSSGGSSSPGGASTSGGSSSGSTSVPVSKAVVPPVATAAVSSTSLKTVLKKGLTIRYSVSEQVTGHFEVLLAASTAKKIGLKGAFATGLPTGAAPEIVVAKAILVTTKGGRNSVKIQFGKKTAALLHKLHKVSLMVRLLVHNGLSNSPASSSTVVSVVTLTN
jgi:uncharacterized membrane protein YgcG